MAEPITASSNGLRHEIEVLRARLAEAERKAAEAESSLADAQEVIRAIQAGEVDAVVVSGPQGEQVFTLKDAEYAYRALVEDMNEGAATLGFDGTVLYCNQRLTDLLGVPFEQVIGSSAAKLVAAEQRPLFEDLLAKASHGDAATAELEVSADRDRRVPVYLSLRKIRAGKPTAFCMVVTDLTERNRRYALIARERQKFLDVLETLPVIVTLLRPDHRVMWVNRAYRDSLGDNVGRLCYESQFGRNAPCLECQAFTPLQTGQPHDWEWTLPDGRVFEIHNFPFTDLDGSPMILEMDIDITERRRVERELRRAGAYHRSLLEASLDPLVTLGPDGKITDVNAASEAATGCTREALIGTDFSDYFTEPEKARTGYEHVFREGFVRDYPLELRRRDGHIMSVLYNATVYHDDSGQVTGVFAAARDVTASRRAEAELEKYRRHLEELVRERTSQLTATNEQLQAEIAERKRAELVLRRQAELLRIAFDAIIVWRLEGGIEDWNVGAERLYGFSESEAVGRAIHELLSTVHPKPWEEIKAELRKKGTWEGELRQRTRDGREVVASVRKQLIRNGDGDAYVLEINRDITGRKQAEQALRDSEQVFTTLANHVPQIVWMCTPDGLNFYFNQRWLDYTGLTLEESYGRGWNTPFHPDDKQAAWDAWNRAVQTAGEVPYRIESRLRAADGSYRWFLMRGEPLRNTANQVERWFGTCTDIHDMKKAQDALLQSEKLASVGRMAATIAHEINNPLASVMNSLFLATSRPDLPEAARQYLETADAELRRVAHITKQALGFYREPSVPALTSVTAVLDSVTSLLKNRIEAKHAVIEKQWDGDVQVTAVAGELRQVFSNLLANSLDVIDENGTIKFRVSRGAAPKDGRRCVRITIADNGKGIDANLRQRIFEPFFTTKAEFGTGLGLWVSKQIVAKHGGTIRMRSSTSGARKGTAFSVVLPLKHD